MTTKEELKQQVLKLVDEHGVRALSIYWLRENHRSLAFALTAKGVSLKEIADGQSLFEETESYIRTSVLEEWKQHYDKYGLDAFKQLFMEKNKIIGTLRRGERHGLSLKDAVRMLGKEDELAEKRKRVAPNGGIRWNRKLFDSTTEEIIAKYGCIPKIEYLRANGYGGYEWQIKTFSEGGIEALRIKYQVHNVKLTSLNGLHFLSLSEVCMANYLLSRNIPVLNGRKYPANFAERYDRKYAVYDLHFKATTGLHKDEEIKVEIFGGGGSSSDIESRKRYQETKNFKLDYHKSDPLFLAVEYSSCYREKDLQTLLYPFIGTPDVVKPHPTAKVPTTMLSIFDEIVEEGRIICQNLKIECLPPMDWFGRTGMYNGREIKNWEPPSYGRLIGHLGKIGYTTVQRALGQIQRKHDRWNDKKCLLQIKHLKDKYNMTPADISDLLNKKTSLTYQDRLDLTDSKYLTYRWRQIFDMGQSIDTIHQMLNENLLQHDGEHLSD